MPLLEWKRTVGPRIIAKLELRVKQWEESLGMPRASKKPLAFELWSKKSI